MTSELDLQSKPDGVERESEPVDPRARDSVEDPGIHRGGGSGSLSVQDAWVAETEMSGMNDGRSSTRTTLYPWDVSSAGPSQLDRDVGDRRSWSELAKWNDGMWESDRKVKNFEADVSRWIQTFCGFLELPEYQRERVTYVLDSVELDDFKHQHLSAEKVILGAISLVVDVEEDPDDLQEWEIDEWIVYDDAFETLMGDVEMSRAELWTARRILHTESSYFDV